MHHYCFLDFEVKHFFEVPSLVLETKLTTSVCSLISSILIGHRSISDRMMRLSANIRPVGPAPTMIVSSESAAMGGPF